MSRKRVRHPDELRKTRALVPAVPLRPVWTVSLRTRAGHTEKRGTAESYAEALERVAALFAADSAGRYESAWVSWRGERK